MSYIARIAESCSSICFSDEELRYYSRHLLLPNIGTSGQRKLKDAHVLVIGAGGLGCPVLQALAGAGVGHLTVIDGDAVAVSNISRQWLHRFKDVGLNKAVSAQQQLVGLNPYIEVVPVPEMLNSANAREWIAAHDLVIDATDDLDVRYLIDDLCAELERPWVHAALYRENSQLCVFWAKYGVRFRDLFPEPSEAPSCAGAGMLGAVASVVANLQALEAIKLIVGQVSLKLGTLISIHASSHQIQAFQLPGGGVPPVFEGDELPAHLWTIDQLRQAQSIGQSLRVIDLRSQADFSDGSLPDAEHITAEAILEEGLADDGSANVLLVCAEGLVSSLLADALRSRGQTNVFHLEGGFQALA